jgi:hypothetical protein
MVVVGIRLQKTKAKHGHCKKQKQKKSSNQW